MLPFGLAIQTQQTQARMHPMPQLSKLEEDIERNKFDFINLMHLAEVLQQVWGPCAGIGV